MPYEDFTDGWTENDVNGHISFTSNHVDFDAYKNEDAWLYKDRSADHFGDFEHKIDAKPVSSSSSNYVYAPFWALSNEVDDIYGLYSSGKTVIFVQFRYDSTDTKKRVVLGEGYGSTEYSDVTANDFYTFGTMYYFRIKKDGTSLTCKIYDTAEHRDAGGATGLLETLSLTLHADHKFRYIFVADTFNTGSNVHLDADIENLDLQEVVLKEISDSAVGSESVTRPERKMSLSDQATGQETFSRPERKMTLSEVASGLEAILKVRNLAAILDSALGAEAISRPKRDITLIESAAGLETILKTRNLIVLDSAVGAETVIKAVIGEILKLVTDSATGSEVIKRLERSMVISEFATGVEQILKTRHLSITDLASGLDQILKTRILPTITDTAVGSESILKERRLLILDAGLGAEQIFRPERYISISDLAQGIEEILKTRNVAAIIDTATGQELVTAIKPGVSPTKLFLIIGNIAIQLTGD